MTFEEFWKENYEKEFGTSEPYYGIASYAFEKGQENCNCVYTDNSKVIQNLEKENAELEKQAKQKQHLADVRLEQSLENYKLFSDERKERIDIDIALEDMTNNLTEAKELLKRWVDDKVYTVSEQKDLIADTEQFLKGAE